MYFQTVSQLNEKYGTKFSGKDNYVTTQEPAQEEGSIFHALWALMSDGTYKQINFQVLPEGIPENMEGRFAGLF